VRRRIVDRRSPLILRSIVPLRRLVRPPE
jgi:hypothetical protein